MCIGGRGQDTDRGEELNAAYAHHDAIKDDYTRNYITHSLEVKQLIAETQSVLKSCRIGDKSFWIAKLREAENDMAGAKMAVLNGDVKTATRHQEHALAVTHHVLDALKALARRTGAKDMRVGDALQPVPELGEFPCKAEPARDSARRARLHRALDHVLGRDASPKAKWDGPTGLMIEPDEKKCHLCKGYGSVQFGQGPNSVSRCPACNGACKVKRVPVKDAEEPRNLGMQAWGRFTKETKLKWLKKFDIDPKWADKDITGLDPYDREHLWKSIGALVAKRQGA